jgi:hypothetical protein
MRSNFDILLVYNLMSVWIGDVHRTVCFNMLLRLFCMVDFNCWFYVNMMLIDVCSGNYNRRSDSYIVFQMFLMGILLRNDDLNFLLKSMNIIMRLCTSSFIARFVMVSTMNVDFRI